MTKFVFAFLTVFLFNYSFAQWSASIEGLYGKEKTMLILLGDKKLNDLVHVGGFVKTGSLTQFQYPTIIYEEDQSGAIFSNGGQYTFPYGPEDASRFIGGTTRTMGWSAGGFISLNRSLSRQEKDWFFVRFDLEHLRLTDEYDFIWQQTKWTFTGPMYTTVTDQGRYNYHAIGFATRAGYKRFFGNKDKVFAQVNVGVSYYHPYYPDDMEMGSSGGYWTGTPFMGVEFEAGAGVGYVFKKR